MNVYQPRLQNQPNLPGGRDLALGRGTRLSKDGAAVERCCVDVVVEALCQAADVLFQLGARALYIKKNTTAQSEFVAGRG